MKKLLLTPLLILLCLVSNAQETFFEGVVFDEQLSTPIEGAIVTIKDTEYTEATDAEGKFIFTNRLPEGQYAIIIEKKEFEHEIFLIDVKGSKKIEAKEVKLEPTKKELYNRKVAAREAKKLQKIAEKEEAERIASIEKELRKKDKAYSKELKKLEKLHSKGKTGKDEPVVDYKEPEPEPAIGTDTFEITEVQKKYAEILNVDPLDLTNVELYNLIEEWDDVTYKYAGVTKKGIDCSSFTQLIASKIYDVRIERTAREQYESDFIDEFKQKEALFEGDLIFFTGVGKDNDALNHVGLYLYNGMFVHSTSNLDANGKNGVQISNLNDKYWKTKFVAAGRLLPEN